MTNAHPTTSPIARLWLLAEPWLVLALVLYLLAGGARAESVTIPTPGVPATFRAPARFGIPAPAFTDRPAGAAALDSDGTGRAEATAVVAPWIAVFVGESFARWDHDAGYAGAILSHTLFPRVNVQVRAMLSVGASFRPGADLRGESAAAFGFADGDRWHGGWGWITAGKRHNADWFASLSAGYRDGFDGDAGVVGWRASFLWEFRFGRDFSGGVVGDYGTTDGPSPALDGLTAALAVALELRIGDHATLIAGGSFDLARVIRRGRMPDGDGNNPLDAFAGAFRAAGDGLSGVVSVEFRG